MIQPMSDFLIRSALQDNYNYQGDYIRTDCIYEIANGITVKYEGNQAEISFDKFQQRVFFRWIEKRNNFKV
jgi:hypothetical protein